MIPILLLFYSAARAEDARWENTSAPKQTQQKAVEQSAEAQALPPLQEQQQQTLLKVLKKPPIPIKAPDKIIRVLFLPYVDKNNILNNYRYSFLKVEEGNWVLGDYLIEPARLDKQVFHPLDNPAAAAPQQQQVAKPKQVKQTKPNQVATPFANTKPTGPNVTTNTGTYTGNTSAGNPSTTNTGANTNASPFPMQP
jgi:hypothetical protein